MRTGTKIGLGLIALTWLAASTAISAHFVAKAMEGGARTHMEFMNPTGACVRVPADAPAPPIQRRA